MKLSQSSSGTTPAPMIHKPSFAFPNCSNPQSEFTCLLPSVNECNVIEESFSIMNIHEAVLTIGQHLAPAVQLRSCQSINQRSVAARRNAEAKRRLNCYEAFGGQSIRRAEHDADVVQGLLKQQTLKETKTWRYNAYIKQIAQLLT